MVGGAPEAGADGRSVVVIVGSRGSSCSGVALARDLILTAGHCVVPGADYKLVSYDATRTPTLKDIATIARHPEFNASAAARHRVTADVALLKLAAPLAVATAPLASPTRAAVGDSLTVIGAGVTTPGDGRTGGRARRADLVVTGQPGTLQIRLMDRESKNQRPGLGACTGDSGAPAFRMESGQLAIAGIVSVATGAGNSAGCGGLTIVTPLIRYRDWIVTTARKLDSPVE